MTTAFENDSCSQITWLLVAVAVGMSAACRVKNAAESKTPPSKMAANQENPYVPDTPDPESKSFQCTWADEEHVARQIGFNWPDAVLSLDLSETDRKKYQEKNDNEDILVVGDSHFIRGWAPVPVEADAEWGFGLWIKVSQQDFADFEGRERVNHPTYAGTISNQTLNGGPTLGLTAEMEFRAKGLRPLLRFTDMKHPLTLMQQKGVTHDEWLRWMSATFHQGEVEPAREPFEPTFEKHGWEIYMPGDLGKKPYNFDQSPNSGDTVKVGIGVLSASATGDVTTVNAAWWVRLDDLSNPNLWSGTLASPVRIQATLTFGSRVWLKPDQVFEYVPSSPD